MRITSEDIKEREKLIKSFFSLHQAMASIRELHPDALATTSVQDLYDSLIEFIELVRFVRAHIEQTDVRIRNPSIVPAMETHFDVPSNIESAKLRFRQVKKEVPVNFENVAGLIRFRLPVQPVSRSERELMSLALLQADIIYLKRRLLASEPINIEKLRLHREISVDTDTRKKRGSYQLRKRKKTKFHV